MSLNNLFGGTDFSHAEFKGLCLDGQLGMKLTPAAYVLPSEWGKIGKPVVAVHFVELGHINFTSACLTVGISERFELGITKQLLSNIRQDLIHGKVQLIEENQWGN